MPPTYLRPQQLVAIKVGKQGRQICQRWEVGGAALQVPVRHAWRGGGGVGQCGPLCGGGFLLVTRAHTYENMSSEEVLRPSSCASGDVSGMREERRRSSAGEEAPASEGGGRGAVVRATTRGEEWHGVAVASGDVVVDMKAMMGPEGWQVGRRARRC